MTTIAVLPDAAGAGFRAVSDGAEATGPTPGQAIDALAARTGPPTGTTLILLQPGGPDEFFTAEQRQRLGELMGKWRAARDAGATLPAAEQAELDALVEAELRAATARSPSVVTRPGAISPP